MDGSQQDTGMQGKQGEGNGHDFIENHGSGVGFAEQDLGPRTNGNRQQNRRESRNNGRPERQRQQRVAQSTADQTAPCPGSRAQSTRTEPFSQP